MKLVNKAAIKTRLECKCIFRFLQEMTDTTFCLFFHNVTPSFFTIMSHFLPGVVSNYTSFEKNQSTGGASVEQGGVLRSKVSIS